LQELQKRRRHDGGRGHARRTVITVSKQAITTVAAPYRNRWYGNCTPKRCSELTIRAKHSDCFIKEPFYEDEQVADELGIDVVGVVAFCRARRLCQYAELGQHRRVYR
jgi:hypothetical protein